MKRLSVGKFNYYLTIFKALSIALHLASSSLYHTRPVYADIDLWGFFGMEDCFLFLFDMEISWWYWCCYVMAFLPLDYLEESW